MLDWTAVGVLLTGVGTVGTAGVSWATRQKAREIHQAVKTTNGQTIGEAVESVAEAVIPAPWDGVERRGQ